MKFKTRRIPDLRVLMRVANSLQGITDTTDLCSNTMEC
jgi:hypothetical protein